MEIFVTDQNGVRHALKAEANGSSLMSLIRDAGLPIRAECGGSCVCATCHVQVGDQWLDTLPPQSDDEVATLEAAYEPGRNSRLACQIPLAPELAGLHVAVAPDWP
jgi:2Fe-2S ferredoxin